MARWHGYFGIENLALNASRKRALVEGLRKLGPASHPRPACLCHWRTRLDGEAAIFEALFDGDDLTIVKFKGRLSGIFGVDPGTIDHDVQNVTFASRPTPVVTFSYGGTDYLRFALFGGVGATWTESGDECRAYLSLFRDEWEAEVE